MSEHVPSHNHNDEPSREDVRAVVGDYEDRLAGLDETIDSLTNRSTESDQENEERAEAVKAAQKERRKLNQEWKELGGEAIDAAQAAIDAIDEADRHHGNEAYAQAVADREAAEKAFYEKHTQEGEQETNPEVEGNLHDIEQKLRREGLRIEDATSPEEMHEIFAKAFGSTVAKSLVEDLPHVRDRLQNEKQLRDVINRMSGQNLGDQIEGTFYAQKFTNLFIIHDNLAQLNTNLETGLTTRTPEGANLPAMQDTGEVRTANAESESGETEPHDAEMPADQHNISEIESAIEEEGGQTVLGWRARAQESLGLLKPVKGAGFGGNVALLSGAAITLLGDSAKKRRDKYEAKLAGMNEEQKKSYLKRNRWVTGLSVVAIGTALYGAKVLAGLHHNSVGHTYVPPHTPDTPAPAAPNHLLEYHNTDANFWDFADKQHHGDFGNPLVADPDHAKDTVNGTYLPGFADAMNRNKNNPTGLANLVSGLKLDGHGDSFSDRNQFADVLHGNVADQMKYDDMVQGALKDPSQFRVENYTISQPYTSTYGYSLNGHEAIGSEQHENYGGTAFKITNVKTGESTYWRKECGFYQQIWLEQSKPRVSAPVYHPVAAPAPEAPAPAPAPAPTPEAVPEQFVAAPAPEQGGVYIEQQQGWGQSYDMYQGHNWHRGYQHQPPQQHHGLAPKKTPEAFKPNNKPVGSGQAEHSTPKPVVQTHQAPKIPSTKPAFSHGAAKSNVGGGHNTTSGHAH